MAELAVTAATGLGASAATASTIATVASVGLTAASAFSSIQAGNQQAAGLQLQARQAELNARAERLRGRQQATLIQEQLNKDLASQNAIFAARGVLQGEGSAEAAQETAKANASRDIDLARFNADQAAFSAEQRASNARSDASAARTGGFISALDTVSSYRSIPSFGGSNSGGVPIPRRKPSLLSGL